MTNPNNAKKQFIAPILVEYGKFEELTQGSASGDTLDQNFDSGTPLADILTAGRTFS